MILSTWTRKRLALTAAAVALTGVSVLAGAGGSGSPGDRRGIAASGEPTKPLDLRALGVTGDGQADDTAPLQHAFDTAAGRCLDGGGHTFLVTGSLRAGSDLCLEHARIVQAPARSPTRAFIGGACAMTTDPEAVVDCHDRQVALRDASALRTYTETRTLFVRPAREGAPLRLVLRHVTIDRGNDPRSGSRTDAAGIWIENATEATLDAVTITGAGKGYGLMIAHSRNVMINALVVRNLVWAPYEGDAPLSIPRLRKEGWNRPMVRELRPARKGGALAFGGTRVQEQLSCVMIAGSRQVTLRDTRIDGCRARFVEGDVPWQADGLNISQDSQDVSIEGDTRIGSTWEGIDIAGSGGGARNIRIVGASIADSFAFGIKMGHRVSDVTLRNTRIAGAGLAGVVLYGPMENIVLEGMEIDVADRRSVPIAEWPASKAGVLIDRSGEGTPVKLRLSGIAVSGGGSCTAAVRDRPGARPSLTDLRVSGCATRFASGD